jgi:hypothetical protein
VLSVSRMGARNTRHGLALVGMPRDLVLADLNAVRSAIGAELRKLYSEVLHGKIPDGMAELIKQLDQRVEAIPRGQDADDSVAQHWRPQLVPERSRP